MKNINPIKISAYWRAAILSGLLWGVIGALIASPHSGSKAIVVIASGPFVGALIGWLSYRIYDRSWLAVAAWSPFSLAVAVAASGALLGASYHIFGWSDFQGWGEPILGYPVLFIWGLFHPVFFVPLCLICFANHAVIKKWIVRKTA